MYYLGYKEILIILCSESFFISDGSSLPTEINTILLYKISYDTCHDSSSSVDTFRLTTVTCFYRSRRRWKKIKINRGCAYNNIPAISQSRGFTWKVYRKPWCVIFLSMILYDRIRCLALRNYDGYDQWTVVKKNSYFFLTVIYVGTRTTVTI